MKRILPFVAACLAVGLTLTRIQAADNYQPGPDSKPQEGVPKGDLVKFVFDQSEIFPGTTRDCTVYIPKQYDPAKPACLFVDQDGVQFSAPTVFDNLIAKGDLPVIIGVFVTPGKVKAANEQALDRFNRSYEYDGLGDAYVRFLLEELLPEVETKTAPDGRPIHLSKNAGDRAIAGASSGAIAAFTAAWERPDAFSRVFSVVGTYVDLRGGNVYPSLVRKYEPKPLRIFLQDGSEDANAAAGDWWMANQELERALVFAGYEVNHAWGDGGHNGKHGTAVFPDAMRWLWKDWPQAPKAGVSKNTLLSHLLIPGEDWKLATAGYKLWTEGLAANGNGEVWFNVQEDSKTYKIGADGNVSEFLADSNGARRQAFGPDGRLYALVGDNGEKLISRRIDGGAEMEIATGFQGRDFVVRHDGSIYLVSETEGERKRDGLWLIRPDGSKKQLEPIMDGSSAVTLSPDQTLLYLASSKSKWIFSYQIQSDGKLAYKQPYYWLHTPDESEAGATALCVDRDGNLYAATSLGVQVCDQAGRVNCIIPGPLGGTIEDLAFGGKDFDELYIACGDKIYRRKVQTKGALPWQPPIKPAAPHL